METISGIWGWVPLVGGIVLGAALLYALLGNRRRSSRRDVEISEAGAERLSDQIDHDDKAR